MLLNYSEVDDSNYALIRSQCVMQLISDRSIMLKERDRHCKWGNDSELWDRNESRNEEASIIVALFPTYKLNEHTQNILRLDINV